MESNYEAGSPLLTKDVGTANCEDTHIENDESPFASSSCDTESMSLQDSLTPPSRKSNRHGDDLSRNDEPDEKRDRRSQESDISRDETITESAANPVSQTITKSESANVFEDAVVSHEMSFADNQVVPSSSNMDTGVTSSKSIQESIQQNEPDQNLESNASDGDNLRENQLLSPRNNWKKRNPARETARLASYIRYPHPKHFCADDEIALARHGFFSLGRGDLVKCFSCGSVKQNWTVEDDPKDAALHSRRCPLVLGTETRNEPIGGGRIIFKSYETSLGILLVSTSTIVERPHERALSWEQDDPVGLVRAINYEQSVVKDQNIVAPTLLEAQQRDIDGQVNVSDTAEEKSIDEEANLNSSQETTSSSDLMIRSLFDLDNISPQNSSPNQENVERSIDETSSVVPGTESELSPETSHSSDESIYSEPANTNIKPPTQQELTEGHSQTSQPGNLL